MILLICQVKHAKKPGLCFPNSLVLPFGNILEIEKFRDPPLRKTFLLRFTSLQTSHVVFLHTLSPAPELVKHCKKLEIDLRNVCYRKIQKGKSSRPLLQKCNTFFNYTCLRGGEDKANLGYGEAQLCRSVGPKHIKGISSYSRCTAPPPNNKVQFQFVQTKLKTCFRSSKGTGKIWNCVNVFHRNLELMLMPQRDV